MLPWIQLCCGHWGNSSQLQVITVDRHYDTTPQWILRIALTEALSKDCKLSVVAKPSLVEWIDS